MRKYLLVLALVATTSIGFAQSVTFGLKAGLNLANQSLSNTSVHLNNSSLTAFHLGGIANIGYNNLTIQTGIFFTTKGEQFKVQYADVQGNFAGSGANKYVLNYLEVPVNFLYKLSIADKANFHLGGGPYFAYGLSTKAIISGVEYQGSFSDDNSYSIAYKNPDYGFNFLAGFLLQDKYVLDVQYGLGLANLA